MIGKILYVDNATYFRDLISRSQYRKRFYIARTFLEARGILENHRDVAIVVTDLIDTWQNEVTLDALLSYARGIRHDGNIPVIAYTHRRPVEIFIQLAATLGLDVVMLKGKNDLDDLIRQVEELLRNPTLYRENPKLPENPPRRPTSTSKYYAGDNPNVIGAKKRRASRSRNFMPRVI